MNDKRGTVQLDGAEHSVAQIEDAALLCALHAACFDEGWSTDAFAGLVSAENVTALVSVSREMRHVGYILLRTAADEAEIISLGVLPGARRAGVASGLLAAGMAVVERQGAGALFLEVAEDNADARAFYSSSHFDEIGRRQAYYGRPNANSVDAIVMRAPVPSEPAP